MSQLAQLENQDRRRNPQVMSHQLRRVEISEARGLCRKVGMYKKGWGVDKSNEKAALWYHKAANQGHAHAQFNPGWIYGQGQGMF